MDPPVVPRGAVAGLQGNQVHFGLPQNVCRHVLHCEPKAGEREIQFAFLEKCSRGQGRAHFRVGGQPSPAATPLITCSLFNHPPPIYGQHTNLSRCTEQCCEEPFSALAQILKAMLPGWPMNLGSCLLLNQSLVGPSRSEWQQLSRVRLIRLLFCLRAFTRRCCWGLALGLGPPTLPECGALHQSYPQFSESAAADNSSLSPGPAWQLMKHGTFCMPGWFSHIEPLARQILLYRLHPRLAGANQRTEPKR